MFQPISSIQPNRSNSWNPTGGEEVQKRKSTRDITFGAIQELGQESCVDSVGLTFVEKVSELLTPASKLGKSVLNHFTGIPQWGKTLKKDLCDGRIEEPSAKRTMQMVGRSIGTAVGARAAFWIGTAAIASGSAPFLIGGAALAGGVLLVSPTVGEKVIDLGRNLFQAGLDAYKERFDL